MLTASLIAVLALAGPALAQQRDSRVGTPKTKTCLPTSEPPKFCEAFSDDFDYLDLSKWKHDITLRGGGNWEFQWYTNNRTNSYVKNGTLYLRPTLTVDNIGEANLRNGYTMQLWGNDDSSMGCTDNADYGCLRTSFGSNIINPVQSALLRTSKSFNFRYGKVEVVAQLPTGDWIWPAIWLLPRHSAYGQWPASGEIDIMESRGNAPGYVLGGNDAYGSTLHWGPSFSLNRYPQTNAQYKLKDGKTLADGFHTYGLIWTPARIITYIDDPANVVLDVPLNNFFERGNFPPGTDNPWVDGCPQAPFDQEFYLIMNVAVGGTSTYFQQGTMPWSNTSPNAAIEFWNAKGQWLPTWKGENTAMKVDKLAQHPTYEFIRLLTRFTITALTIAKFGGNTVTVPLGTPLTLSGSSNSIQVALSETRDPPFTNRFLTFPATYNATTQSLRFRPTDRVSQWVARGQPGANVTMSPFVLYNVNNGSWVYTGSTATLTDKRPVTVGFMFSGTIGDFGWSYQMNQGVLAASNYFGNSANILFREYMSFDPAVNYGQIKSFVTEANLDVIVICTSGVYSPARRLAGEFPNVQFVAIANDGVVLAKEGSINPQLPRNFNVAYARSDVAKYLGGIAAGGIAIQQNKSTVGYMAGFQDEEMTAGMNAFVLGLQKVDPKLKLAVRIMNSYYDEYKERSAALQFVSEGVTILGQETDSLQPMRVITSIPGGYGVGSHYDSQGVLGNKVLAASVFYWGPVHIQIIQLALDGQLGGLKFKYGYYEGATGLSRMSGDITAASRAIIEAESERIIGLGPNAEPLFCGPIMDIEGKLRVPSGTCMSQLELAQSKWFFNGIVDLGSYSAPPPFQEMNYISTELRWIFWSLTIFMIVVLFALLGFTVKHRMHAVMKKASVNFCMSMILCCTFALSGNFLFGLDDSITSVDTLNKACLALPWVVSAPSTLGIAALFAKVWRIHQIFRAKSKMSSRLPDMVLFKILGLIAVPDLIVLICWTLIRPLSWSRTVLTRDNFDFPTVSYGACSEGPNISFFVLICVAYKVIILLYGSYLAHQTQNVPSSLNESKYIAFSIFIAFEVLVIIFPLNYILTTSPTALFIFRAGSNLLINASTPLIVMWPKVHAILWPSGEEESFFESAYKRSTYQTSKSQIGSNLSQNGAKIQNQISESASSIDSMEIKKSNT
ncbi:hypothetical protein HDV05_001133 [Chytridiales sp. JEL 0842]|nr:hypothetical protein HDV05_001133 [Chytridiales sp. JEL 0842]